MNKNKFLKALSLFFKYFNKYSFLIVVIGLAMGFLPLLRTYFLSTIIDQMLLSNEKLVFANFFVFATVIFFQSLLEPIRNLLNILFSNYLENTLEVDVLEHLSKMNTKEIEDESFLKFYEGIQDRAGQKLSEGFISFFNLVEISIQMAGVIIALLSNSNDFILIILCLLFFLAFITKKNFDFKSKNFFNFANFRRYSNYFRDILTDREIYSERFLFKYSNFLVLKWEKFFKKMKEIEKRSVLFWLISIKSISIVSLLSFFIIIIGQIDLLYAEIITPGYLISIITLIVILSNNLSWNLSDNVNNFITYLIYSSNLYDFFQIKVEEKNEIIKTDDIKTLRIENLFFSYPKSKRSVLNGISFVFDSDKSYALVGENGSGKSTLFKILSGVYTDYQGDIYINEKNVRDYKFNLLKYKVTSMFQEFGTYNLTLSENICFSKDVDEDKVINLLEDIEFYENNKLSLNENLGKLDSDVDLSGGQWQKIALARVMYNPKNLLLLDEPTSALDPITESKLYTLMRKKLKEKFSIVISHRLALTKNVDTIIFLKDGKIIESGSHEELMNLGGAYKNMYNMQKAWYENE